MTPSHEVLLVEDDESVRGAIRENLEFRGYRCSEANNGAEALRLLQTYAPEVIICDISMPVMNGIEFLLKSRALGVKTPILLLTGVDDSISRTLGQNAGAFHCVSKPPNYNELDRLIRLSIERQQPE